jgi:hypothetical protein
MTADGIGSTHAYEFAPDSWMPVGYHLYPLTDASVAAQNLADVVVGHERTGHGTTWHDTVRVRYADVVGRSRPEVVRTALEARH